MQQTLNKIDELTKTLQALLPMKPEWQQRLDKKFRLEFNYNSNHLEGNTLTYSETELLLFFGKTSGDHDIREYEEMEAHNVALELIKEWAADKERPLNETMIKSLNEVILVKPFWKEAITPGGQQTRRLIKVGDYKEFPNSVRLSNGEIFEYASVADTPIMMGELIEWFRAEEEKKELHPVALAALLHYKFVRIHPFDDGNGRISRLLMNYILLKNNLPWLVIKSADKKNYITALNKADTGDIDAFVEYVANQLLWSLELSVSAARGESVEESDDIEKEISLWKRQLSASVDAQPKTDDQVAELFIKCLNILLHDYETKMKTSFYDLFAKWEIRGFVNGGNGNNEGVEYIVSRVNNMIENLKKREENNKYKTVMGFDVHETYVNTVSLKIDMLGFKKDGTNTFNIFTDLLIEFQDFKYVVKFNSQIKIEKLYSELLRREERELIISDAVKETFKKIKLSLINPPLSEI